MLGAPHIMRASVSLGFALTLLAATSGGCALKDTAGNGQSGVLQFSAPAEALAVGVPAVVIVSRPDQGVHVCIKGCVDVDPNVFTVDQATCDDNACEVVPASSGLGIVARRAGELTLRIRGRDSGSAITDTFVLTAKAPAAVTVVPDVRPHDAEGTLGLAPGLRVTLAAEVRSASGEKLAHDREAAVFEAKGAVQLIPIEGASGPSPRTFEAKVPGAGEVGVVLGALRGVMPVVVADPAAPHASLELHRYAPGRASSELQRAPLVLESSSSASFALVARDARGQAYFTGARYVATKSEPLVSSYPPPESAPIFVLRAREVPPEAFVAAFGGQSLSIAVAVAKP